MEIKRNSDDNKYDAVIAHKRALERATKKGKNTKVREDSDTVTLRKAK